MGIILIVRVDAELSGHAADHAGGGDGDGAVPTGFQGESIYTDSADEDGDSSGIGSGNLGIAADRDRSSCRTRPAGDRAARTRRSAEIVALKSGDECVPRITRCWMRRDAYLGIATMMKDVRTVMLAAEKCAALLLGG